MKYKILTISDIHWGALDYKTLYDNLNNVVIEKIKELGSLIDMVVIAGDYFDYKLPLNSKSAIYAITWMNDLLELCKEVGIKKVRVIKGTHDHDNNQLEAFRTYEDDNGFFKIFNENTFEETLPELGCLYCPDENIPTKDYIRKYINNIMQTPDIGFFHGSFDIVLPDIIVQRASEIDATNVIFEYEVFRKLVKGPLIAGHWHTSSQQGKLLYTGSFDRWKFGEDDPKGFYLIDYDTETSEYEYEFVENTYCKDYVTLTYDTYVITSPADYANIISTVENKYDLDNSKIRIIINRTTDRDEDLEYINTLKKKFINNKNVKIDVKDENKTKKKKEAKQTLRRETSKYTFIFDPNITLAEKIQQYILIKQNKSIPLDVINDYLNSVLKN